VDRIPSLAIAITFFYRAERLAYLRQICSHHASLADRLATFVITNTADPLEQEQILQAVNGTDVEIITPTWLGHPYLLTWSHREVFRQCLEGDRHFSHYLYSEDDILITEANIDYWLRGMKRLESRHCIPGFLRYELDPHGVAYCADIIETTTLRATPKIRFDDGYTMVSFSRPYQGMYLLDRQQMAELLYTQAGSPDYGIWDIREKAAQGLTFWKVREGAHSRLLVGVNPSQLIDPQALIHHLPNTYVNDAGSPNGKIRVDAIFAAA
jgi:hypothetical protein